MKIDQTIDRFLLANNLSNDVSDPTLLGFSVFFYFDSANSPLFYEGTDGDSAINYLRRIGEGKRANYLKKFKTDLQTLVKTRPEFFQSISGLGGLHDVPEGTTYWMNDRELTFTTLESLGLKMASIIQSYIFATWDEGVRVMLPENLREFSMDVYVHEIRKFKTFMRSATGEDGFSIKYLDDVMSMFVFKFSNCEFNFKQSNPFLDTLDVNGQDVASNQFGVLPEVLHEAHNLNFSDLFRNLNSDTSIQATSDTDDITPRKNPRMFGVSDDAEEVATRRKSRLKETLTALFDTSISSLRNGLSEVLTRESVLFSTLDLANPSGTIEFLQERVVREAQDAIRRGIGSVLDGITTSDDTLRSIEQNSSTNQPLSQVEVPMTRLDAALSASLGDVDVPEPDFVDVALGNIANFAENPISSILERLTAGTNLGNVYR